MRKIIFAIIFCSILSLGASSRTFDGTNDEIDFGNVVNIGTGNVSLCSWAKLTEDAGADIILGKISNAAGTAAGYVLRQNASDIIHVIASDATDTASCQTGTDLDDSWFFVCLLWDATSKTVYAYTNGSLDCSATNTDVGSLSNSVSLQAGETSSDGDDLTGSLAYQVIHSTKIYTDWEMSQMQWLPGTIVDSINGFFPYWGNSPEIDLSGNGLSGTVAGSSITIDGPPIMFGGGLIL